MKYSKESDMPTLTESSEQIFQNGRENVTDTQSIKRFFALSLDDYSLPGFVSGTKHYYGSIDQITAFLELLKPQECFHDTIAAFQEYLNGNLYAEHYVAYSKQRLLEPVVVLALSSTVLENTKWTFYNTYQCPYIMRIESATVDVALVKEGNDYLRIIKPRVVNLQYQAAPPAKRRWCNLDGGFWGHPGILIVDKENDRFTVSSSLYLSERKYESKEKAIESFGKDPVLLDGLCQDVFGDG